MTASLVGLAGHKAEINVTPMIDVLLVLIIIFMIITPLAPTGLRTLSPQTPLPDKEQPMRFNDIVITVEKDKTVLLNRERVDMAGLPGRLARVVQTRGNEARLSPFRHRAILVKYPRHGTRAAEREFLQ